MKEQIIGYRAQHSAAEQRIVLITEEIKGLNALVDKGLSGSPASSSCSATLPRSRGAAASSSRRSKAEQTIAESPVQILNQQNDLQNEVATQLRETQQKLHDVTEQMQAASDVFARSEVKAPQSGMSPTSRSTRAAASSKRASRSSTSCRRRTS